MCDVIYIHTHLNCIMNFIKIVRLVEQLNHDSNFTTEVLRALKCIQFNSIQLSSFQFNNLHTFPVRLEYEVWWLFYICANIIPIVNSAGSPYSSPYTHYNS